MDPIDLFGESVGRLLRRVGLFASAMVVGRMVAETAGKFYDGLLSPGDFSGILGEGFGWILGSLFSSIGPIVVGLLCVFVMSSWAAYWWWVATVVLVSANALASGPSKPSEWLVWWLLHGMIGTGVWFLKAWQTNRWARELVEVQAENHFIRLTQEMEREQEATTDPEGKNP